MDLGRHLLAKGFGAGVSGYKEIATGLEQNGVLSADEAALLRMLAGYRNPMVHFYHEIETDELYNICTTHVSDLKMIAEAYRGWLADNSDRLDANL